MRRATGPKLGQLFGALISIHALLAESDYANSLVFCHCAQFLSTLSLRRATLRRPHGPPRRGISIHALLAESDTIMQNIIFMTGKFLSTLSLRRATRQVKQTYREEISISIHALLAESDNFSCASERPICNFYPRSPCGERLSMLINLSCGCFDFYPRSPCGERPNARITSNFEYTFLSTLSLRRATN